MTPAELSRNVKQLEITTRHLVTEVFAGEYSSAFKGRGIEFADVREYQPGDDIRSIDWNVTARAGRPFVKRFDEERELTILLCVDLSSSGNFGTKKHSKQQLASEVAGVIAFAATKNNDRVGLMIFTDRVEMYVPPAKGSRHVLRMIRELLAFKPTGSGTSFKAAADRVAHVLHRRSVVIVISDFISSEPAPGDSSLGFHDPGDAWRQVSQRHDLVALHVTDPRERELPRAGLLRVQDPETGGTAVLDTSSTRVRAAYALSAERWHKRVDDSLRRKGIDVASVSTGSPYIHSLIQLFRAREARRR